MIQTRTWKTNSLLPESENRDPKMYGSGLKRVEVVYEVKAAEEVRLTITEKYKLDGGILSARTEELSKIRVPAYQRILDVSEEG
jgi:hypothetical protein